MRAAELFEGTIPDDPYGWWISPDGVVTPSAIKAHVEAAMDQLGVEDDLEDDDNGDRNFNYRQSALAAGAIRVLWETYPSAMGIQFDDPTELAIKSLLMLVSANRRCSYRLESLGYNHVFTKYADFVKTLKEYLE